MPRKKKESTIATSAYALETTPEHLRHLGGDCLLLAGTLPHQDPARAVNRRPFTISRGDIVNKANPEAEVNFTTIEAHPGLQVSLDLKDGGWTPVLANEWYFSERMQLVFVPMPDGRVAATDGSTTNALFLWVRSKKALEAALKENRKYTEDISKSMEEKLAETGQKLAWAGMTPRMIEETTDDKGEVFSRRETDFVSRGM